MMAVQAMRRWRGRSDGEDESACRARVLFCVYFGTEGHNIKYKDTSIRKPTEIETPLVSAFAITQEIDSR